MKDNKKYNLKEIQDFLEYDSKRNFKWSLKIVWILEEKRIPDCDKPGLIHFLLQYYWGLDNHRVLLENSKKDKP